MSVAKTLEEVEAFGVALHLHGQKIRIWYPSAQQREELVEKVSFLRSHRGELVEVLRMRTIVAEMHPGVRLVEWNLKRPPVGIDTCSVVTDPALFARSTLAQLNAALGNPRRWMGWTVAQLIDRLLQVGVIVAIELTSSDGLPNERNK
jgi:hypothetical protein